MRIFVNSGEESLRKKEFKEGITKRGKLEKLGMDENPSGGVA
jgi:hypothetical protein